MKDGEPVELLTGALYPRPKLENLPPQPRPRFCQRPPLRPPRPDRPLPREKDGMTEETLAFGILVATRAVDDEEAGTP